jgi:ribosomal-protein-alanine N-acetyltransferase
VRSRVYRSVRNTLHQAVDGAGGKGDSLPIATASLILRRFVPGDAHKVFVMSREPGIRTWIPDQVYENESGALDVLRYLIAQCEDPGTPALAPYVLGVCLSSSSELVGHVGLSPLGNQVEVGYAIEDKHQGKGLASEAVTAMSDWGLRRFDLPLILGIVARANVRSCRVLEKAGFVLADESMGCLHGRRGLVRTYHRRLFGSDRGSQEPVASSPCRMDQSDRTDQTDQTDRSDPVGAPHD